MKHAHTPNRFPFLTNVLPLFDRISSCWLAFFFVALNCGALFVESYFSYRDEMRNAAGNADNLSVLLSERLRADIRNVETLLHSVARELHGTTADGFGGRLPDLATDVEDRIQRQLTLTPVVDNLSVVDHDGGIRFAHIGGAQDRLDKLELFRRLKADPDAQVAFSSVHESPLTQLPVVSIGLRLNGSGKEFAGVVIADLDSFYFQRMLENVTLGNHGTLTLLHQNGQLISAIPEVPGGVGGAPAMPKASGLRLEHQLGWTALGHFPAEADSPRHMVSVRKLPGAPFMVAVGLSERDFLTSWKTKIALHAGFILCLVLLTLALERLLVRERRRARELTDSRTRLEQTQRQLETVIRAAPVALAITAAGTGQIILGNRTLAEVAGCAPDRLVGRYLSEFCVDPDEMTRLSGELDERGYVADREVQIRREDGTLRWLLTDVTGIEFNGQQAVIIGGSDITDRKILERKLMQLATIDSLTGLANRRSFIGQAETEFMRAHRNGRDLSVLMIDIDRFKQINDTHGHATGDRMIQHIARKLNATLRSEDTVGRLGGDEFAVLLPETTREAALAVAERARASVSNSVFVADTGKHIVVSVSVGLATLSEDDVNFDSLLKLADEALYRAKDGGRNQVAESTLGAVAV